MGHPHKKSASKALGVLFMLKRSSPRLTPSVKLNLYKSMVLPVLLYGSVCWFANITNTKVLESFRKNSLKWINNTSNNNYKEILYFSSILPLSLYLQLQDLLSFQNLLRVIPILTLTNLSAWGTSHAHYVETTIWNSTIPNHVLKLASKASSIELVLLWIDFHRVYNLDMQRVWKVDS